MWHFIQTFESLHSSWTRTLDILPESSGEQKEGCTVLTGFILLNRDSAFGIWYSQFSAIHSTALFRDNYYWDHNPEVAFKVRFDCISA